MSENKTQATDIAPEAFIASVENPVRRADAEVLLRLYADATGETPRMWGPSLIGYGRYHYRYDSGREGDFFRAGFSPRKANMTLYVMSGFASHQERLSRLGVHKTAKSCLYITRLDKVDLAVLSEIIRADWDEMARLYPDGG